MRKITASTKIPFGKHRGRRLQDCDRKYLEWIVANLMDSDLHRWAVAARGELERRKTSEKLDQQSTSLEEQADQILRDAGFRP